MAALSQLPPLSEAQMEIMNVVWNRGEATVADVWRALGSRRKLARSTVLTMLTRLQEKGWLCCDEEGHAFRYRAAVPREATLGEVVRRLSTRPSEARLKGWSMALLHDRGVSKEEAKRIKKMIDRAEDKTS